MRTLVFAALGIVAAYGTLFGPIIISVGLFSGPQILIPGIIHVVVGMLALLTIGIMLRKGRPRLGRVSDDRNNPYAPPGDR
jgi:hypothetical protein